MSEEEKKDMATTEDAADPQTEVKVDEEPIELPEETKAEGAVSAETGVETPEQAQAEGEVGTETSTDQEAGTAPGPGTEEGQATETPPMPSPPKMKPLSGLLEDDTGLFEPGESPRILTRIEIVNGLIEKHKRFMTTYGQELESGIVVDPEVLKNMEEARERRDSINSEVAVLKDKRNSLKEENKKMRREFLEMLRIEERLKERSREIERLSEFIERQEYKLQTEGVDLETERRLMKDIRETMDEIRQTSGGFVPEEVVSKLDSLNVTIRQNFETIEELHQKMLQLVENSQVHHQKFADGSKKVREAESRKGWLQRRIALHEEMGKFWETQLGAAEDLDRADMGRTSVQIRDAILTYMEEQEGGKGDKVPASRESEAKKDRSGEMEEGGTDRSKGTTDRPSQAPESPADGNADEGKEGPVPSAEPSPAPVDDGAAGDKEVGPQ